MRRYPLTSSSVVFRDVITLALAGFVAIVILILAYINPPDAGKSDSVPPGNVIVEIRWPDGLNADVDLWVRAPADIPVGYSNLNGKFFNLLRDDLGTFNDPLELNYESAYTRGVIPGEYVVNVHMYNLYGNNILPIKVNVTVSISKATGGKQRDTRVLANTVELERIGQEITVFRFELDETGELVKGSVHNTPIKLREFKQWGS